ncbi:hypothetical protein Patl1_27482 [Pistacia atlantica]|uniref:Uncharacterized protein n=1 Tax=Pistacia atlantica TaxID=434234 RepID=A0ACC1BEQ6_9ROSI|nr:hypothetical protein Patl1_27482 [Pistacia atlantica]
MACSISLSKIVFSAIVMLIISAKITHQYPYYRCTINSTTYSPNVAFSTNLNRTLSSLISNANLSNGFYNTSTGGLLDGTDKAYGLFLCRGDIAPDFCQNCVKAAREKIITLCPKQKEAIVWYDECMLRYSNRAIFADMEEKPGYWLENMNDALNASQFKESLDGLMNSLIKKAVGSSNFFATETVNPSTVTRLYGLAQCTPDIVSSDCNKCLDDCVSEMSECCYGKEGGRVYKPSCNIRFEMYPFYSQPPPPPPPPPPPSLPPLGPPPQPASSTSGNRQISPKRIIEIGVPTVLVFTIILSTSCYCLLRWKEGRKYRAAWKLWREGTPLKLMDQTLGDLFSPDEVIRCIHIGLLCVQEDPTDRPIMATVLLMLNSFSTALPLPKQLAFSIHRTTEQSMPKKSTDSIQYSGKPMPSYVNDEPITELYPR